MNTPTFTEQAEILYLVNEAVERGYKVTVEYNGCDIPITVYHWNKVTQYAENNIIKSFFIREINHVYYECKQYLQSLKRTAILQSETSVNSLAWGKENIGNDNGTDIMGVNEK